jgi:hypothetical protein
MPHRAKLSPRAFGANSGKEARRMLLNPLEEIDCKSNAAFALLMCVSWSLQRNADGKTIAGTFSPDSSVFVL